jgi:hypothetical protein
MKKGSCGSHDDNCDRGLIRLADVIRSLARGNYFPTNDVTSAHGIPFWTYSYGSFDFALNYLNNPLFSHVLSCIDLKKFRMTH